MRGGRNTEGTMAGKFVLTKNAKGQYHFVLKAGNGETIAHRD